DRSAKWRIPFFALQLANALTTAGDYEGSRHILADIVTRDTETPILRVLRSIVTFQLGLATDDAELLKRAPDEKALELAFLSGESCRIAPLVAGHVKLAAQRSNIAHAKHLVARGMAAIRQADHAGDLLALAARYGTTVESARAKSLLMERTRLPHHRVASAYLKLWETHAALRR